MNDDAFLDAFSNGTLKPFRHRDHLRLTRLHLLALGPAGMPAIAAGIRAYAAANGARDKYHETITRFWVTVMASAMELHPGLSFDELLRAHRELEDPSLPFRHWSRARLTGAEARARWVVPDLLPLPVALKMEGT